MPNVTTVNSSVDVLHVVRDDGGEVVTSSVTGLTCVLLDPSQNDDSANVTWTEPITTGYVNLAVTPDELGNWLLQVDNPSGTDEGTYYYHVQSVANAAGLTPSGTYLSTLANLKERLGADPSEDAYLNNLLARSTAWIEARLGRSVIQASYTEYVDGDGSETLRLRQGPVISVASVATVDWSSATVNTTSSLNSDAWHIHGNQDDWKLPGAIRSPGGPFVAGLKNYQVVYSAGWAAVPYDIEELCLQVCVWMFNQRKATGESSKDVGSGAQSFREHTEIEKMMDTILAPYKDFR